MNWGGFLAIASDLQLIPRLMGLDSLQAAVEQVSVAPHRVERDNELVGVHTVSCCTLLSPLEMVPSTSYCVLL